MLKVLTAAFLLGGSLALAPCATAQHKTASRPTTPSSLATAPQYEVGFDLGADYAKPSGTSGGLQGLFPVDARLTFLTRGQLMWEPRLTLTFNTIGTTTYAIVTGLNALHPLKRGSGPDGLLRAPYVTAGAALNFVNTGVTSGAQFGLGAGIGTRVPMENSALRYEGFLSYLFKGAGLPSMFAIGVRAGPSFWH